jgi:hypothetical protein
MAGWSGCKRCFGNARMQRFIHAAGDCSGAPVVATSEIHVAGVEV